MTAVADYIAAIDRAYRRGDATEHSYRPALQALLESRGANIEATNEPQRIAGNAPDFVVRRNATILGHVEAKDIDEPLDKLLKSAQLKRYAEAPPNLAALGEKLFALHLLRDPALDDGAPAFPVSGSGLVEKLRYEAPKDGNPGRVWINPAQYFAGIDAGTWAFRVGGYQVLEKWLTDRKGRTLGIDDIVHYRRVVVALRRTRELMRQVDACAAPLWAAEPDGTTT